MRVSTIITKHVDVVINIAINTQDGAFPEEQGLKQKQGDGQPLKKSTSGPRLWMAGEFSEKVPVQRAMQFSDSLAKSNPIVDKEEEKEVKGNMLTLVPRLSAIFVSTHTGQADPRAISWHAKESDNWGQAKGAYSLHKPTGQ